MSTLNVNKIADASGGVLAPISSVMRNRIINGAMVVAQRGTSSLATNNIFSYPVDRTYATSNSATNRYNVQQNAGSVTPPAGFTNYFGCTSVGSYTPTSGEQFILRHNIEGYNIADLGWGSANAKTITLSFWVRSSLTGTFSGSLYNSDGTRSFPFTYTISAANTWEYETITITGDTTGTWLTTNGVGVTVGFNMGAGSTFTSTANSWQAGYFVGANSSVDLVGTNAATWYMTGLQFEVGTQATGFEYRQYGQELALCQRYYTNSVNLNNISSGGIGLFTAWNVSEAGGRVGFPVQMRATPTIVTYDNAGASGSGNAHSTAVGDITGVTADWINSSAWTHITKSAGFGIGNIIIAAWTASAEL